MGVATRTMDMMKTRLATTVVLASSLLLWRGELAAAEDAPADQLPSLIDECKDIAVRGHKSVGAFSDVGRHKKAMRRICIRWEEVAKRPRSERKAEAENLRNLCTREAISGRETSQSSSATQHKEQGAAICERLYHAVIQ